MHSTVWWCVRVLRTSIWVFESLEHIGFDLANKWQNKSDGLTNPCVRNDATKSSVWSNNLLNLFRLALCFIFIWCGCIDVEHCASNPQITAIILTNIATGAADRYCIVPFAVSSLEQWNYSAKHRWLNTPHAKFGVCTIELQCTCLHPKNSIAVIKIEFSVTTDIIDLVLCWNVCARNIHQHILNYNIRSVVKRSENERDIRRRKCISTQPS